MSPFRHLPDDIIYKIVTSEPLLPNENAYTDPHVHAPSILSQVSKSWRSVVHSIPSLWNHIRCDCMVWNYLPAEVLFERINHFSRLSRPLPFSIRLDETVYELDDANEAIRAIPFLFDPENAGDLVLDLGLPRILKWVLASWAEPQHRLISLTLDIPLLGRILGIFLDAIADRPCLPAFDALRMIEWRGKDWDDLDEDVWGFHTLLEHLPQLRRLWISGYDQHYSHLFNMVVPEAIPIYNNLKFLYLEAHLTFQEWTRAIRTLPRLEGAWFSVEAPLQSSINVSAASRIQHDHIKVLNLHVCRTGMVGYASPVFPLFNIHISSLDILNVYFDDIPGLDFVHTDFGKAFPLLTTVHAQLTWTPRWPLDDFASLLLSLPVSTSLVIRVSTQRIPEFTDILQRCLNSVFVHPHHLALDFIFRRYSGWRVHRPESRLTKSISELRHARSDQSTSISFRHFHGTQKPRKLESATVTSESSDDSSSTDSSDSSSNSSGDTDSSYDSYKTLYNESKALLAYFKGLRLELGGEVEITSRPWSEQMSDPYAAPLEAFRQRYFT
ncbi:hypothetical protein BJ165DRAFT_1488064 [Panaeolus papilionaceus]|nr:hypothetical protein BJ165DRAFT_1488064 [Panaeolus papilionaceus]